MTKKQIIAKLEGKVITTADSITHIIQDGRFETADGTTMRLERLCVAHLRRFLENAK